MFLRLKKLSKNAVPFGLLGLLSCKQQIECVNVYNAQPNDTYFSYYYKVAKMTLLNINSDDMSMRSAAWRNITTTLIVISILTAYFVSF